MKCPYCKSSNLTVLKIHILRPIGAKKYKCLLCYKSFIKNPHENNINENNKT